MFATARIHSCACTGAGGDNVGYATKLETVNARELKKALIKKFSPNRPKLTQIFSGESRESQWSTLCCKQTPKVRNVPTWPGKIRAIQLTNDDLATV